MTRTTRCLVGARLSIGGSVSAVTGWGAGAATTSTLRRPWRLGAAFAVFAVVIWACGGSNRTNSEQGSTSGGSSSGKRGGDNSDDGGSSSSDSSAGGDGGTPGIGCGQTLPPLSDYSQNGPYTAMTVNNSGPDGGYTIVLPTTLGENGFRHPIATWGNGITTTPATYPTLLNRIASNGIVVIASNNSRVTPADMTGGLDWMVQQNAASGSYQGKLDTACLISIGYSWGGMGAVNAGSHADVVTTVSFHGLQGMSANLKTPLLLFTSTTDTFVTASGYVTPTYNASVVQTFYATLTAAGDPSNQGHLIVINASDPEYAVAMAWLRLWVYGDQGALGYFYGPDAKACQSPFTCQTKEPGATSQMTGF
ncbi:MAG TPA: hypothetical protein VG815_14035 [Chloroflexota bacterium]|jgi:hypothetical protein|nr:hypothetical protein [Chloroflexota bacterium]